MVAGTKRDRAAKLICTTPEFDDLAAKVGLGSHTNGVTDAAQRAQLRAELDGTIAHLYGLTEEEFAHILSTFPIVPEEVKQAALEEYRNLAPKVGDAGILKLIAQGEGDQLEFKSSAWWDIQRNRKEKFNKRVADDIAAFLNTQPGETLLLGVDDDGRVLGIEYDYNRKLEVNKNRDIYANSLISALLHICGQDCGPYLKTTFHQIDGKDICRVVVLHSPKPVFIKDGQDVFFYIRSGSSNRPLNVQETNDYIKNHWE